MPDSRRQARLALRAVYERVAEDLAGRPGLRCEMSGRCCRFREAGHDLYLTRLEYEEMVARGGARAADADACPWLEDGLCANREGRALACRTYFCSDEAQAAAVTERWHAVIRNLHADYGVAYDYRSLAGHMEGAAGSRD